MKIQELLLHEVMETGFESTQISPSTWSIDIPQTSIKPSSKYYGTDLNVRVDVNSNQVDGYTVSEVSFGIPGTTAVELEKIFENNEVFKLLKTIIDVIETYEADIILFVPNDVKVDIGNKKARLYKTVALRMKRLGKVGRIEEFQDSGNTFQAIFPSKSKAWKLSNDEVQNILIQFVGNKTQ